MIVTGADVIHGVQNDTESEVLDAILVAEAPWSVAEWAVAPRFDHPRAIVLVLVLG